jgi:hypothetical protein
MLSYVYFGTNDLVKAIAFYNATLAPLGMERCITGDPEWDRISAGWGTYEEGGARELDWEWRDLVAIPADDDRPKWYSTWPHLEVTDPRYMAA